MTLSVKIIELREEDMVLVALQTEAILFSGGIVISPTDTVYGILGHAANKSAIAKMFALKNRPMKKAFPVFVRDIAMARRYAYISDTKARFLERVWPGPVTVVFHHKEKLPEILTGGLDTLGMRIPSDPFLTELLKRIDAPIAQTSANISYEPPARNIDEIKRYFERSKIALDLVIYRGALSGQSSTVIDLTGNTPIIVRTGMVTKEVLDELFKTVIE